MSTAADDLAHVESMNPMTAALRIFNKWNQMFALSTLRFGVARKKVGGTGYRAGAQRYSIEHASRRDTVWAYGMHGLSQCCNPLSISLYRRRPQRD